MIIPKLIKSEVRIVLIPSFSLLSLKTKDKKVAVIRGAINPMARLISSLLRLNTKPDTKDNKIN